MNLLDTSPDRCAPLQESAMNTHPTPRSVDQDAAQWPIQDDTRDTEAPGSTQPADGNGGK